VTASACAGVVSSSSQARLSTMPVGEESAPAMQDTDTLLPQHALRFESSGSLDLIDPACAAALVLLPHAQCRLCVSHVGVRVRSGAGETQKSALAERRHTRRC
jgi:hypothetical protein